MYLTSLALQDFRNFTNIERVEFSEGGLLVAAAPNATGKTNFLESLVVLLRGKSFRAPIEECVRWGAEGFLVHGEVQSRERTAAVAVRYHVPTRKLRIEEDGVPVSPVTFYGSYPLVLFLPADTYMFSRGPAERRNFFNRVLVGQSAYVSALVQYQRALKQRNTLLKRAQQYAEVAAWTEVLTEHAGVLWQYREQLVSFLATHLSEVYGRITGEALTFRVRLEPGRREAQGELGAELAAAFAQEQRFGYTLYGPHRDDLGILVGGRSVAAALSQGQTRSLVVALKLAVCQYLELVSGESPLLLLDEVLSELDEQHQEALLKELPQIQTLLTCTTVPAILRKRSNVHLLDLRSITADDEQIAVPKIAAPVDQSALVGVQ